MMTWTQPPELCIMIYEDSKNKNKAFNNKKPHHVSMMWFFIEQNEARQY